MGQFIELTGKKFGRLTVIKRAQNNKYNKGMWKCKCDCGNECVVTGSSLRSGVKNSCGCLWKENLETLHKQNTLDTGIASMRQIINTYKQNAKKRGYTYSLTEKQFKEITKQNCYYCGGKPNAIMNHPRSNGAYIYNGLDRTDNTKGYTIDNVVPCCKRCNVAKNNLTFKEFKDWIVKVYKKIQKKGEPYETNQYS